MNFSWILRKIIGPVLVIPMILKYSLFAVLRSDLVLRSAMSCTRKYISLGEFEPCSLLSCKIWAFFEDISTPRLTPLIWRVYWAQGYSRKWSKVENAISNRLRSFRNVLWTLPSGNNFWQRRNTFLSFHVFFSQSFPKFQWFSPIPFQNPPKSEKVAGTSQNNWYSENTT